MSWTSSEAIDALAPALVKTLGELSDVPKNKQAKIETRGGGSYGYRYADLGDALGVVRPAMSANGLTVMQSATSPDSDSIAIWTTILHTSGQWMTFGPLTLPAGRTAQESGSAITYARRYALLAALGLAAEDDDGATAGRRRQTSAPTPRAQTTRTPAEGKIREMLDGLPEETAKGIRAEFRSQFGSLIALDPSKHDEALAWVTERVGR